ncbi:Bug family tripartite tricarboxylate transporter substrate binding protein [Achromobacter mucicolens]|uniref:Bug family tripartite tricarboxylate transporter substrate binding protein n=1 Tax=Achromobacter mucicolens TaxID=1389922 RepID=UPI00244B8940|nr:tripartite tricarboxylate transporter substrate binding protein [Achromobacter mucicolens]MDH1520897.1 tripartite tricarboxylate transporter substrate binding protein [Achromobacter mucicolens]
MFRTRLLARCALAACLTPALPAAMAQTYPAKPITLVVPHSAGGTSDILARTVATEAAKTLGQTIVIDNKGGANGTIAAKQVASSAPDGYTLLLATASTHGINPSLYSRISYDAVKDFTPVTLLATVPNVLVVGPNVKAGNVQELIAFIRSQGDKTNMGSAGAGTPGHLAGEMFKSETKLQFTHVPYKGGSPAITDLIGGQIDFMFTTIPGVLPHVKAGSLRALAVTSPERSSAMPDVPTMAESGLPGFQAVSWHGIVAPAGTPDAVVAQLNQALTGALAAPEVKQRLMEEGARASGVNTAEFGKFIQTEMAAWAKAVKDSGATAN